MHDLLLRGGQVYTGGRFVKTNVYVDGERIAEITSKVKDAKEVLDCQGRMILPGLLDPHVHMELDLGFTKSCDDFYTGTVKAVKGGVTTIIDFLDPIVHESQLDQAFVSRLDQAKESLADYAFHATLGNFQGDVEMVVRRAKELGMASIKVFTTYSESDRMVPQEVLRQLLDLNILTMVHAEDDSLVDPDWQEIATYESSRPLECELSALQNLLDSLGRGRLYVVHVSSGSGVELLAGKENVVIESCPHYFYLTCDHFKGEDGGLYLLAPALRSSEEVEKLIAFIGEIDTIGTDHCPFRRSEKLAGTSAKSIPKGIGSIQYSFLLMMNKFGDQVIDKMSAHVADVFGLSPKGRIREGNDADLFIYNPQGETLVQADLDVDAYSVYEGMKLKGSIESTMIRGKFVMQAGKIHASDSKYVRSDSDEGDRECAAL